MEISVLVVDAQRLLAESLGSALGSRAGLRVLPEYPATTVAAIDAAGWLRPDVVLLDYWMPGPMSGAEAVRAITQLVGGCRVIVTSAVHSAVHVARALDAGAVGYLPKTLSVDQLTSAVRRANAGESPLFADQLMTWVAGIETTAEQVDERAGRLERLSARECEVLQLLASGCSAQRAANKMFLSLGTVRNHIHDILKKTGARTQLEAVQMFKGAAPRAYRASPTGTTRRPARGQPAGVNLLIADEQDLFAESLAEAVAATPAMNVVGAYSANGTEALAAAVKLRPDVVIYDYWMPATSGPGLARYLSSWAPATRVLLMSWLHGPNQVARSHASGAVGLASKRLSLADLVETIEAVHRGHSLVHAEPFPRRFGRRLSHQPERCWERLVALTPREVMVLQLVCAGRSSEEMAEDLGISPGTAQNHLWSILKKTRTDTKQEAIELARHEGLVREMGAPVF